MSTNAPYPHLFIPDQLVEAVKSVSPDVWKKFFLSVKANKLEAIETCPDSDLTKERGKLTMVSEIQGIFHALSNYNPKTKE